MTLQVGNGGAYKSATSVDVGVGGAWKRATRGWIGVGGVWKDFLGQYTQMTAGFDGNATIGYSAGVPYTPTAYGSLASPITVNGKQLVYIGVDPSAFNRIIVGFASASDPGQSGVFTTFASGLPFGNLSAASADSYSWVSISGAAYWTWNNPSSVYVDGNSYTVGFMQ